MSQKWNVFQRNVQTWATFVFFRLLYRRSWSLAKSASQALVYFSLFLFLFFFLCGVGGMTCSASFSTSVWRQSFFVLFLGGVGLASNLVVCCGTFAGWGHWLHSSDCCGRWYFLSLLVRSREVLYLVTCKLSFCHRYIAELFFISTLLQGKGYKTYNSATL